MHGARVMQVVKLPCGFLFPNIRERKKASWCLSWHLAKPEKAQKSPALYARLAIKPDTILSRIGKKEERLHELLILHRVPLHV